MNNIFITNILFIFFILNMFSIACGDQYQTGMDAGSTAAKQLLEEINTPEKINSRISEPMTNEGTSLQTFGPGIKEEVPVSLTTESSEAFVVISGYPSDTGDFRDVEVRIDRDFDGTPEYRYSLPVIVSGVCTNGIISAAAGTWSARRYFEWEITGDKQVRLTEAGDQDVLSGCNCINDSCGWNPSPDNRKRTLEAIGGGVVATLQENDPHLVVTHVETSADEIKYYGQNSDSVTASTYFSSGTGTDNPEQYFHPTNDAGLKSAASSEAIQQSGDDTSPMYYSSEAFSAIGTSVSEHQCAIKRTIYKSSGVYRISNTNSCGSYSNCRIKNESICSYYDNACITTTESFNPTSMVKPTECVRIDSTVFCADGSRIYGPGMTLYAGIDSWFTIKREYQCESNDTQDPEEYMSTSDSVVASTEINGSTFTYTDGTGQKSGAVPQGLDLDCEKGCKIKRLVPGTDATEEGTVTDLRYSNTSYEVIIRMCSADNICQVESGETIVTDCSCINQFTEAASVMQSLLDASNDMICSDD